MTKARLFVALSTLIAASSLWAVPSTGTAHQRVRRAVAPGSTQFTVPAPIRFREVRDRGLLVSAWINGSGPYVFALDTGAGVSLVSQNVVTRAALPVSAAHNTFFGGLSGSAIVSDREANIDELALGNPENVLPPKLIAVVASSLPSGIDGILDPTEAFDPFGYSIDLPNHELQAFDSKTFRLTTSEAPIGGAVVRWVRDRTSRRPYVRLGDGRLALLDTGSGFGLASSDAGGLNHGRKNGTRDLGGGMVQSRRVGPSTVSIGALVLRGVPTDILTGAASGTPVILGRDALYPFRITFDPVGQLIAFEPVQSK